MLLLANIAHAKLVYGDLEGTKKDMDAAWKTLDQLEGVDNAVNASYYRVAADYYKVTESSRTLWWISRLTRSGCRRKQNTGRITSTRYCIWHVLMLGRTSRQRNVCCARTTLAFRPFWGRASTTLGNWWVAPVI